MVDVKVLGVGGNRRFFNGYRVSVLLNEKVHKNVNILNILNCTFKHG